MPEPATARRGFAGGGRYRALAAGIALLALSACASPFSDWRPGGKPEGATHVGVELVEQDSQRNCGAAALASVMRYWDAPVPLDEIRRRHPPANEAGYSVGELLGIARANGLRAFAFAMTDEFVRLQVGHGRPLIFPIAKPTVWAGVARLPVVGGLYAAATGGEGMFLNHFVTLVGYDEENYYLLDPDDGPLKVAQAEFARMRAPFGNAGILIGRPEAAARPPATQEPAAGRDSAGPEAPPSADPLPPNSREP